MATNGQTKAKKSYHKRATGIALKTVEAHAEEAELKLYGSCFCPFVQRVWIALEAKAIPYQYLEVDPYAKPAELLAINPRGLVPALRHGPGFSTHDSSVIMEYLEDLSILDDSDSTGSTSIAGGGTPLLPPSPAARAHARLWTDHINRNVIPGFYRLLQAQEEEAQTRYATEMKDALATLVNAVHPEGPFFEGSKLGFVDIQFAPWMLRFRRVLTPYRGWPEPEAGSRWAAWVEAVEGSEVVSKTTSGDELYLDSYERYAENRPNTSQLANAVNSGKGLP